MRGWRSAPEALLLRVDKAKDRAKLCAATEAECFPKISADAFQVDRKAGALAGSEEFELETVRPLENWGVISFS